MIGAFVRHHLQGVRALASRAAHARWRSSRGIAWATSGSWRATRASRSVSMPATLQGGQVGRAGRLGQRRKVALGAAARAAPRPVSAACSASAARTVASTSGSSRAFSVLGNERASGFISTRPRPLLAPLGLGLRQGQLRERVFLVPAGLAVASAYHEAHREHRRHGQHGRHREEADLAARGLVAALSQLIQISHRAIHGSRPRRRPGPRREVGRFSLVDVGMSRRKASKNRAKAASYARLGGSGYRARAGPLPGPSRISPKHVAEGSPARSCRSGQRS